MGREIKSRRGIGRFLNKQKNFRILAFFFILARNSLGSRRIAATPKMRHTHIRSTGSDQLDQINSMRTTG
jgi:hypothetical protein